MIAPGRAVSEAVRQRASTRPALLLGGIVLASIALRLWFGMRLPLDADEATTAYTAFGIVHGHLALTEADQHYLGALEAYWVAPFVAIAGPSLLAVRLAMSLMGALYVLGMYLLGRTLFKRQRHALLLAAIAAIFPVFELTWTMKARSGYAELMVFEAVLLLMAIRMGWSTESPGRRGWALFGLVAGLAIWNDPLILVPLAVVLIALGMRLSGAAQASKRAGLVYMVPTVILGFSPWLADQLSNDFHGVASLPDYSTGALAAVGGLIGRELPIFMGTSGTCSRTIVPPVLAWAIFAAVGGAAIWIRREQLAPVLRGHFDRIRPLDMVLAIAPASLLAVTVGRFNATPCEPRYLLPLAVPLALAGALLLMNLARWRPLAALSLVGYLILAVVTMGGATVDSQSRTVTGAVIRDDPAATAAFLRGQHLTAVFADYWLARPIQYAGAGDLTVGVYAGPAGFPDEQSRAESQAHPSYLFVAGDPMEGTLDGLIKRKGILAERITYRNLVLYKNLSAPLEPADLGAPASY